MAIRTKYQTNDPLSPYRDVIKKKKTAEGGTASVVSTPAATSQGSRELMDAYGVHIDQNGIMTKGNATDRDYLLAGIVHGGQQAAEVLDKQEATNKQTYDGTLADYRRAADRQIEALGAQRQQTRRDTSVMMDKLSRYMPALQRMQGTVGSGISESSSLAQYNAALARMSQADRDYSAGVSDVEGAYLSGKLGLDQSRMEADTALGAQRAELVAGTNNSLQEAYGQFASEDKEKSNAAWEDVKSMIDETIDSYYGVAGSDGKISQEQYDRVAAYCEGLRDRLTPEAAQEMDRRLSFMRADIRSADKQKALDAQTEAVEGQSEVYKTDMTMTMKSLKPRKGQNVTVNGGDGKSFHVQIDDIVTDESITAMATQVPLGGVFMIGNEVYVRMKGNDYVDSGTVVRLEGRPLYKLGSSNEKGFTSLRNHIKETQAAG